MAKIQSDKINFGTSFVVSSDSSHLSSDEIQQAKVIAQNLIEEAKKKALIIEGEASTKASQIIEEAKTQALAKTEEITEAARQKGHEIGYNEGFEQITSEMQDKILNLDNFAKSEFEFKKRIIKSLHKEILELTIMIAKKVCQNEFNQNPQLLEKLITAAISELKEKENINIIVNPIMAEKIYSISNKLKEIVKTLENIKIIEDNSISPDGTIVESVGSRVDSRISAQIDKIAQELFNDLNTTSEDELVEECSRKILDKEQSDVREFLE